MKHAIKLSAITVWPYVIAAAVVYLLGAFGNASWKPVDWTSASRWICVTWACAWGYMLWARIEYTRRES